MREAPLETDALVLVTDVEGLAAVAPTRAGERRWLYLGKDVAVKDRLTSLLAWDDRWPGRGKVHDAAAKLRQPFLDFVAEVGARQADPIDWWSSRFSWKMWITSDLFLLICYLDVAQEAIREAIREGVRLLVVVEDRWLLCQLGENCAGAHPVVRVARTHRLRWAKSRLVLRGLLGRARWLWAALRDYIRQRCVWPGGRPQPPSISTVAIFSHPVASCFQRDGGWDDPQLPGLDRVLRDLDHAVVRFSLPGSPGFERELARRHAYCRPLILWLTAGGLWRSLRAFWWPTWPDSLMVGDLHVRRLAEREWWMELGRSSLCGFRLLYECLHRMLGAGRWRAIVIPYENQPWEKLIALGGRERGVEVIGIQTAILSRYYLAYFLGHGEAKLMPLPDKICTSGPHADKLLIEGGNPPERLRMCGSIRYPHVAGGARGAPCRVGEARPRSEVLVALPIDLHMSEHLLAAIRAAFPTGGAEEGLHFRVRPHPMAPLRRDDLGFPADVITSTFQDLAETLREVDAVVFYGSTVGFEALAAGRLALRYRADLLLDVDEVYEDGVPTCGDDDLREVLLALVGDDRDREPWERAGAAVPPLFVPFERERLQDVFHGKP